VKLNRTGYLLIALFSALGIVMLVVGLFVSGTARGILILNGVIWFAVVAGLYLYARQQKRKGEHERWLFQNGISGTGTVVDWSSNATINDEPVVKLVLDVALPGQQPRRQTKRILMSRFAAHRMRPGVVLPVHANPQSPNDLLVRW
jgi:hypothetical protein